MMKKLLTTLFTAFILMQVNAQAFELVADINQDYGSINALSSSPTLMTEFNNKMYFVATTPNNNRELHSYDGTIEKLELDLSPGPSTIYSSSSTEFFAMKAFKNALYFTAKPKNDNVYLYRYDGVNAPIIVSNVVNDWNGASILYEHDNHIYFITRDTANSHLVLNKYDGVNPPSVVLSIYENNVGSGYFSNFVELNNTLFFYTNIQNKYYAYDGINAPTLAPNTTSLQYLVYSFNNILYNNKIYFNSSITNSSVGIELYSYDGVNAPVLVEDINPGSSSGTTITDFTVYKNKLYFSAGANGKELHSYDGIDVSVVPIPSLISNPYVHGLIVYNNKLIFQANDGVHGNELYEYDGVNPPIMVQDLYVGAAGSHMLYPCVFQNKLYLHANDGTVGFELYEYDGTDITLTKNIFYSSFGSGISNIVEFNNKLYFTATGPEGRELWSTDGVNTVLDLDLYPGLKQDGTANSSNINIYTKFNNKLIITANIDSTGYKYFEYDGVNPPSILTDIPLSSYYFIEFNNKLIFNASDSIFTNELWEYDGINPSQMIADINPGAAYSNPMNFYIYNNKLYFSADDGVNGIELWMYDGVNFPSLVADIFPGAESSRPNGFTEYQGKLYFSASGDTLAGRELWMYDGVNAPSMVMDFYPGVNASNYPNQGSPSYLSILNNKLVFIAYGPDGGNIWEYDGLNTPTKQTNYVLPEFREPYNIDNKLYFWLDEKTGHGSELYIYDGINAPKMVAELNLGIGNSRPSNPSKIVGYNGYVYLSAADGIVGWLDGELFRIAACSLDNSITVNGAILTANQTGASYQWIDGDKGNTAIVGATSQTYTAPQSGNYACIISNGTCEVNTSLVNVSVVVPPCAIDSSLSLNNTTLTANQTGATYQWVDCANGNTAIAGATSQTFTPTQTGNYACIINNGTCQKITMCVYVDLTPACTINQAVSLNNTTITVAQTGATYQWVDCANGNAAIAGATSQTFTPTQTGTYACVVDNGTCQKTSNCVFVNLAPPCTIDRTVSVNNGTITVAETGATYQWIDCSNGNTTIAGATSQSYTPTQTGNYACIIDDGNCQKTSLCTNVVIAIPCTIDKTVSLNNATLTAAETGATYQWIDCDNGNATITGATSQTYTATQSGNFACIIDDGTCVETSACTNVVVAIPCTIDKTVSLNNATLTAAETGATYQWIDCDNGNASISGATSQTYTATQSGNFACIIDDGNCQKTSTCTNVVITGIHNLQLSNQIEVYPNPTVARLNIVSQIEIQSINIYNLLGEKVQTETNTSFSIAHLNNGVYIMEILTENGITNKKIVKK